MKLRLVVVLVFLLLTPLAAYAQDGGGSNPITADNAGGLVEIQLLQVGDSAAGAAWSPDGTMFATGLSGDTVVVYDTTTWEEVTRLTGENGGIYDLTWSPDGKYIATANRVTSAHVWDVATGEEALLLGEPLEAPELPESENFDADDLGAFTEAMGRWGEALDQFGYKDIDWSPDGSLIITASSNYVLIYDAVTGEPFGGMDDNIGNVWTVDWAPDSKTFISASLENMLIVEIDFDTEEVITNTLDVSATNADWRPIPGRVLAVALYDEIGIVDLDNPDQMVELQGHTDAIISIAWSPDGTLLASAGVDQTLRVWDAVEGGELVTATGHTDTINAIGWSPDGSMLATAAYDGTVRIWGIPDTDGDGLLNNEDNCPAVANEDQLDGDDDGFGDACDLCPDEAGAADGCPDADEDGVADLNDNCPEDANPDQADFNDDGTGDMCQDSDEDGWLDAEDACPAATGDLEGCPDTDGDGFSDAEDQCPNEAGPAEGCPDADEDGVADLNDNCPADANADQADFNDDGTGDMCQDSDEDSVIDAEDECPAEAGMVEANGCLYTGAVTSNVNLRSGPGTTYDIVGVALPGEDFVIMGRNEAGDWLYIRQPGEDGEPLEAWIAGWLTTTDADVDALSVVEVEE